MTPKKTNLKDKKGRELFDFEFDGDGLYEPMTVRSFSLEYAESLWVGKRVQLPDKVFDLKCTVCGIKTGEMRYLANHPIDLEKTTAKQLGFDDVRCDEHRQK